MYRYTSIWDLVTIIKATVISALILNTLFLAVPLFRVIPSSILLLDFMFTAGLVSLVRISVRLYYTQTVISVQNKRKNEY